MIDNTDSSDVVKDALSDTTAAEQSNKSNVLSSKSEEFFRKSVKQQVEELAMEQGLETDYRLLSLLAKCIKLGKFVVKLLLIKLLKADYYSGKGLKL